MATAHVITVRLTPEQYQWVLQTAEDVEETISWVLRDLLNEAMRDEE